MFKSKEKYKKVVAIVLSTVVLLTSFGFQLDFHFCQDELKSFSLIGNAKTCYEIAGFDKPAESNSSNVELKKVSCCGSLQLDCGIEDEFKRSEINDVKTIDFSDLLSSFIQENKLLNSSLSRNFQHDLFEYFIPPLLNKPDLRFIQVFRL